MDNREQIEQSVISASAYNGNDTEGLLKEIEDVYKKAQAFDEILEGMTNAIQHSVKKGIELDEAINIATYLDDNDITKLALINKLNEIKNNGDLSKDKRSEETKKYNDKLQDILDKEKQVLNLILSVNLQLK